MTTEIAADSRVCTRKSRDRPGSCHINHFNRACGPAIREVSGIDPGALPDSLLDSPEPVVVRGLVEGWPMARAGRESPRAASTYLLRRYSGMPVVVATAPPEAEGRYFYNADLSGFNFRRDNRTLDAVFMELAQASRQARPSGIYVASTDIDACLPGFRAENDLNLGARQPSVRIWLGNRSRIAAHHDQPTNLACVVSGRRRFTLFPPDQLSNLYVGPLEFTPAGQAISLVDFAKPDFARFPRFAQALEHARVAELSTGDALLIPSLWWHHIEGLDDFNVLVNYWWRRSPEHRGAPHWALMLAMMAVRDLPPDERLAWQEIFRHYVFEADEHTAAHIPEDRRGAQAPFDDEAARAMRSALVALLGR